MGLEQFRTGPREPMGDDVIPPTPGQFERPVQPDKPVS